MKDSRCMSQDPHHLDDYLAHNVFLPDLNNEGGDRRPQYRENLAQLDRLALFRHFRP